MDARKLTMLLTVLATLFVLGVAVWTGNPWLGVLAVLGAGVGFTAWGRSGPR